MDVCESRVESHSRVHLKSFWPPWVLRLHFVRRLQSVGIFAYHSELRIPFAASIDSYTKNINDVLEDRFVQLVVPDCKVILPNRENDFDLGKQYLFKWLFSFDSTENV